jgi:hypothetical protein
MTSSAGTAVQARGSRCRPLYRPGAAHQGQQAGRIVHRVLTDRVIGVDPVPRRARDQRARGTPQRRGRSACRSSRRSPRAWPTHGRAGDPPWCEGLRRGGSVPWIRIREGSGCRCPRRRSASRLFRWRVLRRRISRGFIRWRFVQTQTTQDVIAVRVSAQRGQGIQAAQQSCGRCGAFQVLNRRQGFFKTLDATFKVRSTGKVRILERERLPR